MENIDRPCIRNKCLLYPICFNREEINCSKLVDYLIKSPLDPIIKWKRIYEILPRVRLIGSDK